MQQRTGREIFVVAQSANLDALVRHAASNLGTVSSLRWEDAPRTLASTSAAGSLIIELAPMRLHDVVAIVGLARSRRPTALLLGLASRRGDLSVILHPVVRAAFTDIVLIDEEDVVDLIRAHLCDESRRGAYAASLRCAYHAVPRTLHPLVRAAIIDCADHLSLSELADHVGISRWALHRKLQRALGMTAAHFVDWLRIVLAAALLEHSAWPVKRIAMAVGFDDLRAFRGATKQLLGRLPEALHAAGTTEAAAAAFAGDIAVRATFPRTPGRWPSLPNRKHVLAHQANRHLFTTPRRTAQAGCERPVD